MITYPKIKHENYIYFAKEQLDTLKNNTTNTTSAEIPVLEQENIVEDIIPEEVTHFAEIVPATQEIPTYETYEEPKTTSSEKKLSELSQDELFEKLQNYKRLLDNGLIMQGEYDVFKKEILGFM